MKSFTLTAVAREPKRSKNKNLAQDGYIAANIYGKNMTSIATSIKEAEFNPIFKQAGETGVVYVTLEKTTIPTLIHNAQKHPITSKVIHVEFYKVDLKEKVKANVPIVFVDESPAVTEKIGVMLELITEVEIEALPAELPEKLILSAARLTEVDQELKVADLEVPHGVEVLTDPEVTVVKIAPLVSKEAQEQEATEKQEAAESTPSDDSSGEVPAEEIVEDKANEDKA